MLILQLGPSRRLAALLMAGHACAALCVVIVPLPVWLKVTLVLAVLLSLAYALLLHGWRRLAWSVVHLQGDREGGLRVRYRDGREIDAHVLPSSTVAPFLTVVVFRAASRRLIQAAVIMPDAVTPELFRQLRVWLKWKVGQGLTPDKISASLQQS